jgi:2-keto-3-deoxy-6-phosphogluconate aldolase
MNLRTSQFQAALHEKRVLKAIAGIANFDTPHVLTLVRAASQAGVTAVDVAATSEIVSAVRKTTDLTVFASCIQPKNLLMAADHGADVVELGNYDALYKEGLFFTADDVLKLAEETVKLVRDQALISVTIPGHLSIDTQIHLAKTLESMGVTLLQTEGASRALAAQPQIKPLTAEEKAQITFSNTRALACETSLPIMTASGINLENIQDAFAQGAAAVGVGSAVNTLTQESDMADVLVAMMQRMALMSQENTRLSRVS